MSFHLPKWEETLFLAFFFVVVIRITIHERAMSLTPSTFTLIMKES